MSEYKVPQDVEADDKIIGPFSFRQFIYLIIVALAVAMAWGLSKLFIFLAVIPMPIIIFFGALALPLRKDQPMEIFLAAMVSFYLKPHKRLWDPDGIESLIEITAPKAVEIQRTKDFSQDEAQRRLNYLSEIVDTQGWAVRGVGVQPPDSSMKSEAFFEAQQTVDMLDDDNTVTKAFDNKIEQSNVVRHDAMTKIVSGQQPTTNYFNGPVIEPMVAPEPVLDKPIEVDFNPYPDIQQSVIQPLEEQLATTPPVVEDTEQGRSVEKIEPKEQVEKPPVTTSEKPPSADIINLATNDDLSIATIAREAKRIHEKQDLEQEVVISLR